MSSGSSSSSSSTGSEPPPRRVFHLGWLIAFLAVTTLIAFAYQSLRTIRPEPIPDHLQPISKVPDFQLTAQDGSIVSPASLRGKIWVANFIFTRCQGPCPVMTSRMAELNKKLRKTDVVLVSFSVDPDYDQPAVLAEYGAKVAADPARWKFLTGPKDEMETLIVKGLLQPLAKDPDGMPAHSTRFVLVDREGSLRGFQDGNDPEVVQKILMDIGDLLRESPLATK
ncbi:MAG: SCO family protein [Terrimicrobiaceae bacterium]